MYTIKHKLISISMLIFVSLVALLFIPSWLIITDQLFKLISLGVVTLIVFFEYKKIIFKQNASIASKTISLVILNVPTYAAIYSLLLVVSFYFIKKNDSITIAKKTLIVNQAKCIDVDPQLGAFICIKNSANFNGEIVVNIIKFPLLLIVSPLQEKRFFYRKR